uniref:hypothetical protein n=1 Tax=Enterobacter asburiae TaxID=61645 RepID=UPI001952FA52
IVGTVRQLSRSPGRLVVELADGAPIAAAFVIDCSGRACISAGAEAPLRRLDRMVACFRVLPLDEDVEAIPATLVEAVAEGWWY